MVLTLIHNVFKSFGVVLVAVIFIQVQKSSSQRSSRICTKHWASLKKQNEISLSGMLSFFFVLWKKTALTEHETCLSFLIRHNAMHTVTASDSDPTLDQSFLLEVMFGSGVQDRKHSPNCSSRVQAVGHHFPSHCLIIPSIRHFILSFIVPDKEQLHDVCPPSPLLWLVTR